MVTLTNSSTRLYTFAATLLGFWIVFTSAEDIDSGANRSRNTSHNEEQYYEWSVWSPCTRTCGIGIQFRGQRCLRKEKRLCRPLPREHQTCNTQACPPGGTDFRDLQCGIYNGRDIFINGERAKWMSYIRGSNRCLLFCYPYGEQLYYYFGRARDGTQCSKEPYGVCVFGRCKPVGCDNVLQSGVYRDKCRVCGGNSTTCEPVRGTVQRAPNRFERLSGYAELVTIPRGSTSVTLTDNTWNYLALRRQNGEFAINGNRIVNWPSMFKVGDMEVEYKRSSDNVNETLKILGPTTEDLIVKSLLVTKEVNVTFEYWKPIRADKVVLDDPLLKLPLVWQRPYVGWGKWTACSASCGGGIRVRARHCGTDSTFSCANGETEVEGCNKQPCDEIKAEWSEWGPWNGCSASCGVGAKVRFRYCKRPSYSVKTGCSGERFAVEKCNIGKCPEKDATYSTTKSEFKPGMKSVTVSLIETDRQGMHKSHLPTASLSSGANPVVSTEKHNESTQVVPSKSQSLGMTTLSPHFSFSRLTSNIGVQEPKTSQRTSTSAKFDATRNLMTSPLFTSVESTSQKESQTFRSSLSDISTKPSRTMLPSRSVTKSTELVSRMASIDFSNRTSIILAGVVTASPISSNTELTSRTRKKSDLTSNDTSINMIFKSSVDFSRTVLNTSDPGALDTHISNYQHQSGKKFQTVTTSFASVLSLHSQSLVKTITSFTEISSLEDTSNLQSKLSLKDSINSEHVLMLRSRTFDGGQPLKPATLPSPTLAISPKVQMETPTLNHTLSTLRVVTGGNTQATKESQTRKKMVTSYPGLQTNGSFSAKRSPHLVISFGIGKASILGSKSYVSSADGTHGRSIEHESNFKADASLAYSQVAATHTSWQRRNVYAGSALFASSSKLAIVQLTPVAFLMQSQSKAEAMTASSLRPFIDSRIQATSRGNSIKIASQSSPVDNASKTTILSSYYFPTTLHLSMDTSEILKRRSKTMHVEGRVTQSSVLVESSHIPKAAPYSWKTPSLEKRLQYLLLMTALPSSTTVTSTSSSQHDAQPSLKAGPQRESSNIKESQLFTFHRSAVYFANVSVSTESKMYDTTKVECLSQSQSAVELRQLSSSSPTQSRSDKDSSIGSQSILHSTVEVNPSMPFFYIESTSFSIIHSSYASAIFNKESILDTTTGVNLSKISSSNPLHLSPFLTTSTDAIDDVGTKSTDYSTSRMDSSKLLSSNQLKYPSFSSSSSDADMITSSLMTSGFHLTTSGYFFSTTTMQDEESMSTPSMTTASIVSLAGRTTVVKTTLARRSVERQNLVSITEASSRTVQELSASPSARSIMRSRSSILPHIMQCPPCDLSDRLLEKYCISDYAVLVRVRSKSFTNGSLTSYTVKVKKAFKIKKFMKKKPEVRIVAGKCHCNIELVIKKHYIIMGSHLDKMNAIEVLTLTRESFLAQWESGLDKEVERANDYCSSNFTVTPMAVTSPAPSAESLASTKSSMIRGNCGPCKMQARRDKAYCTSDFVIHVKIRLEAINEFSFDVNYRIALIHVFKTSRNRTALTKVWLLNNVCRCPELVPNKEYLLMGSMAARPGSSDEIALIGQQSYVQEWRDSMFRRLAELANSCEPKTTSGFTPESTNEVASTALPSTIVKAGAIEVTSQPKTSSTTAKPTVQCRRCRISKKQTKNYCTSDYVIHAKILHSSFNETTQERKYTVQIRHVLGTTVSLTDREELWVIDDYCQCPVLTLQEEYLIMGTVEASSRSGARLIIPSRPYVAKWKSRMRTRLNSGICDS